MDIAVLSIYSAQAFALIMNQIPSLGGCQSDAGGNPIVLASYYPVYSFDPACTYGDRESQKSAMIQVHYMLASMPGVKNAAWFHEGGNTWLQQEAYLSLYPNSGGMGDLNGCASLAPFMPIECYSGWLQDGSFGGPSAEGVNMYNSRGQQLCTWRTYLGSNQYGNGFPTFLGNVLGVQSVAWIWKNCPSRVLEGMAAGLGVTQLRRLICEYRVKQAIIDIKKWIWQNKQKEFGMDVVNEPIVFGGNIITSYCP